MAKHIYELSKDDQLHTYLWDPEEAQASFERTFPYISGDNLFKILTDLDGNSVNLDGILEQLENILMFDDLPRNISDARSKIKKIKSAMAKSKGYAEKIRLDNSIKELIDSIDGVEHAIRKVHERMSFYESEVIPRRSVRGRPSKERFHELIAGLILYLRKYNGQPNLSASRDVAAKLLGCVGVTLSDSQLEDIYNSNNEAAEGECYDTHYAGLIPKKI